MRFWSQYFHIVEFAQVIVVDGNKSHLTKAFALHTIVYDITETVEDWLIGGFLIP